MTAEQKLIKAQQEYIAMLKGLISGNDEQLKHWMNSRDHVGQRFKIEQATKQIEQEKGKLGYHDVNRFYEDDYSPL